MLISSFNRRLEAEEARREVALAHIQQEGAAARGMLTEKVEGLKHALNPANLVREHPWGTVLALLGAGLGAFAAFIFWPRRRPIHTTVAPGTQKVVIEVVGGKARHQSSSAFKPVLDLFMHSLPAIMGFLHQHFAAAPSTNGAEGEPVCAEEPANTEQGPGASRL